MGNTKDCGGCDSPMSKPYMVSKNKGAIYELGNLPNPIPKEVEDSEDLQKGITKWKIIPYAGTTKESGDSLMDFFIMLAEISPTASNCIVSLKRYCFGGGIDIQLSQGPYAFRKKKELADADKEAFIEEVLGRIEFNNSSIEGLGTCHHEDVHQTGDQWLEVRLFTVAGEARAAVKRHNPKQVRYKATAKNELRRVYISKRWDLPYLNKNEPEEMPAYPYFEADESGVLRTMIHEKTGKNEWYGRPESKGSIVYQYREFQDSMYLVKQAANNFAPQVIVEAEDDNPDETNINAQREGYENEADRIADNFTTQGDDPQSIWYMYRPFGAKPMTVVQINPNTKEKWYKVTGDIAEDKIIASFQWSKRLMVDDMGTGFSSEVFLDRLKTLIPVIRDNQQQAAKPFNKALGEIIKWLGVENRFKNYGIKYYSPYREILEEAENAEDGNANNGVGSNQGDAS